VSGCASSGGLKAEWHGLIANAFTRAWSDLVTVACVTRDAVARTVGSGREGVLMINGPRSVRFVHTGSLESWQRECNSQGHTIPVPGDCTRQRAQWSTCRLTVCCRPGFWARCRHASEPGQIGPDCVGTCIRAPVVARTSGRIACGTLHACRS
jgi:hypothetical protein